MIFVMNIEQRIQNLNARVQLDQEYDNDNLIFLLVKVFYEQLMNYAED
jgi:hypothetical protein